MFPWGNFGLKLPRRLREQSPEALYLLTPRAAMPVGFYDRAPLEDLAEDGLKRFGASARVF